MRWKGTTLYKNSLELSKWHMVTTHRATISTGLSVSLSGGALCPDYNESQSSNAALNTIANL